MGSWKSVEREVFLVWGLVVGLTGVVLGVVWIRDLVEFLKFGFALSLVGLGVWLVGRAVGLNWAAVWERAGAAIRSAARGSGLGRSRTQWRCPACGTVVEEGRRYCHGCGAVLAWQACPSCGGVQLGEGAFCGFCGKPLADSQETR